MSEYMVTDTELESVADAIRTQTSSEETLEFPEGFVSAIQTLSNIQPAESDGEYIVTQTSGAMELTPMDEATALTDHTTNTTIHTDATEKASWDGAVSDLATHTANSTIHVTSANKTSWNGAVSGLSTHTADSTIHVTSTDKSNWNTNITDLAALDERVDNIIAQSGTSSTEVVDARTDASGSAYTTLKNRLDTEHTELRTDLTDLNNHITLHDTDNDVDYSTMHSVVNGHLVTTYTEV